VLPFLNQKQELLTDVLVWEGGIEQRFGKGIARKDLEELEQWGVGVL
jgi:hypothetical protein